VCSREGLDELRIHGKRTAADPASDSLQGHRLCLPRRNRGLPTEPFYLSGPQLTSLPFRITNAEPESDVVDDDVYDEGEHQDNRDVEQPESKARPREQQRTEDEVELIGRYPGLPGGDTDTALDEALRGVSTHRADALISGPLK